LDTPNASYLSGFTSKMLHDLILLSESLFRNSNYRINGIRRRKPRVLILELADQFGDHTGFWAGLLSYCLREMFSA